MDRTPAREPGKRHLFNICTACFLLVVLILNCLLLFTATRKTLAATLKPAATPVAPSESITYPLNNSIYTLPSQISIVATATTAQPGATIGLVQFFVFDSVKNTNTLLGSSTTAPYHINWVPSQTGSYQLSVTAFDNIGDSSTSTITVAIVVADPLPGTTCFLSYQLASQWSNGFSANVTINNRGTTIINGWTLQFTFPGDQTITTLWNGNYTQSGQQVTVTNASWNSSISPGSSISLGFNGNWTSNNTTPQSFTLNGQPCFRQLS